MTDNINDGGPAFHECALQPLIREALILWWTWARHDLQLKNPAHPDLPEIVLRLRDLRAERYEQRCYLRALGEWL